MHLEDHGGLSFPSDLFGSMEWNGVGDLRDLREILYYEQRRTYTLPYSFRLPRTARFINVSVIPAEFGKVGLARRRIYSTP